MHESERGVNQTLNSWTLTQKSVCRVNNKEFNRK